MIASLTFTTTQEARKVTLDKGSKQGPEKGSDFSRPHSNLVLEPDPQATAPPFVTVPGTRKLWMNVCQMEEPLDLRDRVPEES